MKIFLKYFKIVLGTMLVGFAISGFYTPNKIVSGGVSGISTILFHTLKIPTSVTFGAINLALLILAYKFLGKKFVFNTLLGAFLVTVFVEVFSHIPPVTNDELLASIFGAVCYGFGIGLALVEGASTGGTDILGRLVQRMYSHIRIGTLLLVVDAIVILSSLIVFKQLELTLYGIIALAISSFSINWLIQRLNVSKLAFVVTDFGEEITKYLVSKSPRGITLLDGIGGYTMKKKNVLICALKESETQAFEKRILKKDPDAFIIFTESTQILGNGFRVYK